MRWVRFAGVLLPAFGLGVLLAWLVAPPRILVRWETASEVETVGFFLLRAESPEGPFTPVSDTPVAAQGIPPAGASYRFEDRGVVWGRTYFYRLEELDRRGVRHRHPEMVRARAGVGWGGALAAGAALAALTGGGALLVSRRRANRRRQYK